MNEVAEALRQVIEGEDFSPPSQMLSRLPATSACRVLSGFPYSIASNVAHSDAWNRFLLAKLLGQPKVNIYPDFPVVAEKDWPKSRSSFLQNLERAHAIASADPFRHQCESDEDAKKLLLKIAFHTTYHLGQVNLLKRALRSSPRKP